MYNATEQFAEFNKANVAQATKFAALAMENAEKLMKLNLNAAKVVLAQGVEGAQAAASVKDVQDLLALRAKFAETGVAERDGLLAQPVRDRRRKRKRSTRRSPKKRGRRTRRASRRGSRRPASPPRPVRTSPSTRSSRRSPRRPPRSTSSRRRRSKS